MNVLAIDTSSPLGSIALTLDGELRAELTVRARARHGETLLPLVEEALRHGGARARELSLLAVGLGPGSFTGTRVGVATMQGLHLATGAPIVGVCTLEVLARAVATEEDLVAPIVDAQREEVFAAAYQRRSDGEMEQVVAPFAARPELAFERLASLADGRILHAVGNGAHCYRAELEATPNPSGGSAPRPFRQLDALHASPRAAVLAILAVAAFENRGPSDPRSLEPLYVRPSDAQLPIRPLNAEAAC